MGNELLTDWGAYKENQKFEEVCERFLPHQPGQGVWADEAENVVIDNLGELGNELLTDWGAYKENQKFEEVCDLHPEAVAKKTHTDILDEHLR